MGFTSDVEETLATRSALRTTPCPEGYTSSVFAQHDWTQQVALDLRTDAEKGYVPTAHRHFLTTRAQARHEAVRRGSGQWFGAHDTDGRLVASLGIRVLPDPLQPTRLLARYQHVVTDAAHRRRGLAAHLLGVAGPSEARRRGPSAPRRPIPQDASTVALVSSRASRPQTWSTTPPQARQDSARADPLPRHGELPQSPPSGVVQASVDLGDRGEPPLPRPKSAQRGDLVPPSVELDEEVVHPLPARCGG